MLLSYARNRLKHGGRVSRFCSTLENIAMSNPISKTLTIVDPKSSEIWPMFQIMDANGNIDENNPSINNINKEETVKMYVNMIKVQSLDDVLYNAQRQGRISFYMQNSGEEGIQIGSAAALSMDDTIFAQYRETGVLIWRGFTYQQATDQCFSNESDLGRGRQMPVHYGSKELNFQTISSPLTTQLPQAVGAAYAKKLDGTKSITCCYFGEGAASEGDFHAALNFAATLKTPMIFFCRNNGYAISTSTADQYAGDGIISRAAGYGMHGIRVDGNDIFAVKEVTSAARKLAVEQNVPVLIEAMSYRRGHHSTSDDSTRYRSINEIKYWHDKLDPVTRLRVFMERCGWWDDQQDVDLRDRERLAVLQALAIAEKRPKPSIAALFEDVYAEMPPHLRKQKKELEVHMSKYPHYYTSGDSH